MTLLDGTYELTAPIALNRERVTLSGGGDATVLRRLWRATGDFDGMVEVTANQCAVTGLYLDWPDNNENSYVCGIYVHGACYCNIHHNTISKNYNGVFLYEGADYNRVEGNLFLNAYYAIPLWTASHCLVSGNLIHGGDQGVILEVSANHNTVTGNVVDGTGGYGLVVDEAEHNLLVGNVCDNCDYGVELVNAARSVVLGNVLNRESGLRWTGVILDQASDCLVLGNYCTYGQGRPEDYTTSRKTISLIGSSGNMLLGNLLYGKNYDVTGGANNQFVENKFE